VNAQFGGLLALENSREVFAVGGSVIAARTAWPARSRYAEVLGASARPCVMVDGSRHFVAYCWFASLWEMVPDQQRAQFDGAMIIGFRQTVQTVLRLVGATKSICRAFPRPAGSARELVFTDQGTSRSNLFQRVAHSPQCTPSNDVGLPFRR
jgi:hypothetical protein